MATTGTERRLGARRGVALLCLLACVGVGGFLLRDRFGAVGPVAVAPVPPVPVAAVSPPVPDRRAEPVVVAPVGAPVGAPAVAPTVPGPSFDVVRVSPQGNAVIAGRAEPEAEVVVRDGAQEIARVQADRQGAFVAVPAAPLPEGGRSLTLAARGPDAVEQRGDGAVVVIVPPQAAVPAAAVPPPGAAVAPTPTPMPAPAAMAVLVPGAGAPRVLQEERAPAGSIGLDTVDYDDKGSIRFTGQAAPGSRLRVYVDNAPVGDAVAEANRRWVLTPGDAVTPGVHTLRVDRVDAGGRVTARVELPFQRASVAVAELGSGRMVVQPGQNLWRMARAAYGSGVRYTVIYLANREHIRDPRLIYPGQAFSVPAAP